MNSAEKLALTHHLFGQLTLPCLEKLAEVWASILDPAWITAKQSISSRSKTGQEIPDYLGIDVIFHCFLDEPEEIVALAREQMMALWGNCRTASSEQNISIASRVAVILNVKKTKNREEERKS